MWIKDYILSLETELGEVIDTYCELGYYYPDIDISYGQDTARRMKELIQLINFLEA